MTNSSPDRTEPARASSFVDVSTSRRWARWLAIELLGAALLCGCSLAFDLSALDQDNLSVDSQDSGLDGGNHRSDEREATTDRIEDAGADRTEAPGDARTSDAATMDSAFDAGVEDAGAT